MAGKAHLIIGLAGLFTLAGCASTPNSPSLVLDTHKTPDAYAQCVYPKWQSEKPDTTISQGRNNAHIVAGGKVAADQILDVYRVSNGSEVALYLRGPLPSELVHSRLENLARECL